MLQSTGKEASSCDGTPPYKRHRPERTLLYQLIQAHYPVFEAHCTEQGKPLPAHIPVRHPAGDLRSCTN